MTAHFNIPAYAPRPDWFDNAACRGMGPDVFFPTRPEPTSPSPSTVEAKNICRGCTTRLECYREWQSLPWELRRYGVWGGLATKDREKLAQVICAGCGGPFERRPRHKTRFCEDCRAARRTAAVTASNIRRRRVS
jgi:hypothetical protein